MAKYLLFNPVFIASGHQGPDTDTSGATTLDESPASCPNDIHSEWLSTSGYHKWPNDQMVLILT